MSTTIGAQATYYHASKVDGSGSYQWISGGPRKGTINGQNTLGLITFSRDSISNAVSGKNLPSAKLVLKRDAAYGTDPVDISLEYTLANDVSGYKTHEQCVEMGERRAHIMTTVSGNTAEIQLPGAWLVNMKSASPMCGIIVYQEAGEGTDNKAVFTTEANLVLEALTDQDIQFDAPTWMRAIGAGDIVSGTTCSHLMDLKEIEYYINLRRKVGGLSGVTVIGSYESNNKVLLKDWPAIVRAFQNAIDDIYDAESKTGITWKRAGDISTYHTENNIILPNAGIINQIRNALEAPVTGGSGSVEYIDVLQYARTYFDNYGSDFTVNLGSTTTWARKGPWSGMNWEYTTERGTKEKKYNRRFGIWLLKSLLAGKTVNSAKLRLTKLDGNKSGSYPIRLYPVKVSAIPDRASINQVFLNQEEVLGTATATVGQTVDIPLTNEAITKLQTNNSYYGVGVDDHDNWCNFGTSATLIINE